MAVMRLTGDRLTARAGRVPIVRIGAALGGVALGLALLAEHPAAAFIAFACLGVGIANVFPLVVSAASRSPAPGMAIATVSTGGYAGVLVGPPAIGFLADASSLPPCARADRDPVRRDHRARRSRAERKAARSGISLVGVATRARDLH